MKDYNKTGYQFYKLRVKNISYYCTQCKNNKGFKYEIYDQGVYCFYFSAYLICRFSLDCSFKSFLIGLCLFFSAWDNLYPPGEFSNSFSSSSSFRLTLLSSRVNFFSFTRLGDSGSTNKTFKCNIINA